MLELRSHPKTDYTVNPETALTVDCQKKLFIRCEMGTSLEEGTLSHLLAACKRCSSVASHHKSHAHEKHAALAAIIMKMLPNANVSLTLKFQPVLRSRILHRLQVSHQQPGRAFLFAVLFVPAVAASDRSCESNHITHAYR